MKTTAEPSIFRNLLFDLEVTYANYNIFDTALGILDAASNHTEQGWPNRGPKLVILSEKELPTS